MSVRGFVRRGRAWRGVQVRGPISGGSRYDCDCAGCVLARLRDLPSAAVQQTGFHSLACSCAACLDRLSLEILREPTDGLEPSLGSPWTA